MNTLKTNSVFDRETYYLGAVKLEPTLHRVTVHGREPQTLTRRQFEALALLASNYGHVVTREALHPVLCQVPVGGRERSALTQHIRRIRKALGDSSSQPRYIKTVRGGRSGPAHESSGGGFYLLIEPRFEGPALWDDAPYRGLQAFEYEHAPIFFGRARAVDEILSYLHRKASDGCAFMLVTGAGGAGKSSVVKAGVVPRLCQEPHGCTANWRRVVFCYRGGQGDVFDDLADAVVTAFPEILESTSSVRFVAEQLRSRPHDGGQIIQRLVHSGLGAGVNFALVVDQMEELFCAPSIRASERDGLLDALDGLARSGWCYVIATLRSDFLPSGLQSRTLATMVAGGGIYTLCSPTVAELREMIVQPAKLLNLALETVRGESLSDRIIQDASAPLESLAVLEFVLMQLYDRRTQESVLTFEAYQQLGGIEGCLARRADEILSNLPPDAQASLFSVLARLCLINRNREQLVTGQSAPWHTVATTKPATRLLEAFRDAHLLSVSRARDGTRIVRVAHEALLTSWGKARSWVANNQHTLQIYAKVSRDAQEWLENDRHTSLLLPNGLRLSEGRALLDSTVHLSSEEQAYVEASVVAQGQRQERRQRMHRWVRAAAVAFAAMALVTTLIGIKSAKDSRRAQVEAKLASTTTNVMAEMFQLAGPGHADGQVITAKTLLERNTDRVLQDNDLPKQVRARLLDVMGRAYIGLGDYDAAFNLLQRANELWRELAVSDPLGLADSLHHLGSLQLDRGNVEHAITLVNEAIGIYESQEDRLRSSNAYNTLALARRLQGQYEEAKLYYERALAIKERRAGPLDEDVAVIKGNIGQLLLDQGLLDEAEPLLAAALASKRKIYPSTSPKIAYAYNSMGTLHARLGQLEQAKQHYEEALAVREATLDPDHPLVALSLNNLGRLMLRKSEIATALSTLQKAVDTASTVLPEMHPYLAIYRTNLADAWVRFGDYPRALSEIEMALSIYAANDDLEPWRVEVARSVSGASLAAGQCSDGPKQILEDAHRRLLELRPVGDIHVREALARLQSVCAEQRISLDQRKR